MIIDAQIDTAAILARSNPRPAVVDGVNFSRRQQMLAEAARDDAMRTAYDLTVRTEAQRLRRELIVDTIRAVGERVSAKFLCRELELERSLVYSDLRELVAGGRLQSESSARNSRGYSHLIYGCVS